MRDTIRVAGKQFQGISGRSRNLLKIGEGQSVDYKANVKGLEPADLVAFANSQAGGAILIGVAEDSGPNGNQIGKVIGCPVDDTARLQILGKAQSCNPPIAIEVLTENLGHKPFLRIEIPSSPTKPHCTNGGTYLLREDGRNTALLPRALLQMLLEVEADQFSARFRETTRELSTYSAQTLDHVRQLEGIISDKIEEIGSSLGWADYKVDQTADTIETVQAYTHSALRRLIRESGRLKAIAAKLEVDDPVRKQARADAIQSIKKQLVDNPVLLEQYQAGKPLSLSLTGELTEEISKDEFQGLFSTAARELLDDLQKEKARRKTARKRTRVDP